MKTFLLVFFLSCLVMGGEKTAEIPREQRYPDVGKLHIDEAKILYGQPTSSARLHGDVQILRWSRTSSSAAMDDWIANPYKRIPPGGHVDPTSTFTMVLTFDKNRILASRRFEGDFPGFGDYDAMFRKP